ncbi:hypothetical protein [Bradyrhizobium sp.]|jgi:hypothetical protein|uniref:hypothetical protein n=1 Tax=Bradyrhizobium sp. TaxID=376 RepID=UPI002C3CF9A8|nr:hypothetical protein [Bradyrhizobium sp.]HWX59827.1 hypothetical protein [Bradyrhizobium sp.]
MTGSRDTFSYRVVIYAACFFVAYKLLFQLSFVDRLSKLWLVAGGLIVVHAVAWLWCVGACVFTRGPRRLASLACAAALVAGLQWYVPDGMRIHFWLHRDEYVARVAATHAARDGRVSLVLFSYGDDIPATPSGESCATEIVYDDSKNIGLISRTPRGRADMVEQIDEGFYFRYLPCQ